jgi:hypothetical protein
MAREKGPSYWLARQTDEELVEYINDDDVDLSPEVHIDVGLSSELPGSVVLSPELRDGTLAGASWWHGRLSRFWSQN